LLTNSRALAGILWALFITRTTISVPALIGCISLSACLVGQST
jgi:multidrug efflux pump subunit AcrB